MLRAGWEGFRSGRGGDVHIGHLLELQGHNGPSIRTSIHPSALEIPARLVRTQCVESPGNGRGPRHHPTGCQHSLHENPRRANLLPDIHAQFPFPRLPQATRRDRTKRPFSHLQDVHTCPPERASTQSSGRVETLPPVSSSMRRVACCRPVPMECPWHAQLKPPNRSHERSGWMSVFIYTNLCIFDRSISSPRPHATATRSRPRRPISSTEHPPPRTFHGCELPPASK